jgi:hypothetical protein
MAIRINAHGITVCPANNNARPWRCWGIGWGHGSVGFTSYTVFGGVAKSAIFTVSLRGVFRQQHCWDTNRV